MLMNGWWRMCEVKIQTIIHWWRLVGELITAFLFGWAVSYMPIDPDFCVYIALIGGFVVVFISMALLTPIENRFELVKK